ncbi:MAG: anthranilate synthase component I [Candidatus Omnitrophica bacterium]|nr:anthranilate synthase component I [Candidatus Omnitrophota bacterium]
MELKFYPTEKEFKRLARRGNLIPLFAEVQADLETPVSAFLKVCKGSYAFLLESVEQGEKLGRYSFLGDRPKMIFQSKGCTIDLQDGKGRKNFVTAKDPLEELRSLLQPFHFVPLEELPRFCGGLVGFVGYDMVRFFEKIPNRHKEDISFPDSFFLFVDHFVIFDHLKRSMKIVALAHIQGDALRAYRKGKAEIQGMLGRLSQPLKSLSPLSLNGLPMGEVPSNMTQKEFEKKVRRAKDHIRRGDVVQVVLSQRFEIPFSEDPFEAYRALRSINPSPYMYYLKLGEVTLVGSSPEIFVQCEESRVKVRPIAGTRPRGKTEKEDLLLEKELLRSQKERAEHVMLVDLGRNDIGRVCRPGTVQIEELMVIERYSHVMHVVSEVSGVLRRGEDRFGLLRATFPAGTVTGAPKIRAMEIIDELEECQRGPYAGCVGYFSFSGNFDSCITIRTMLIKGRKAYIQAGAGIVADSKPRSEYQETVNKAQALFQAIACAKGAGGRFGKRP